LRRKRVNPREVEIAVIGAQPLRHERGGCRYLGEDNRCTIYSSRPLGCRVYPFDPDFSRAGKLVRLKIVKATEADLGAKAIDERQKALLEEMVVKRGRHGRKNGKGFYDYPEQGPKRLWPGLREIGTSRKQFDARDPG